jgi:hypothetical protein
MLTHASPQFTPAQLIDAGRRAESEGRPDLAVQFYRHLTEHFAEAAQAAEAYGALGRIGLWQPQGGLQPSAPRVLQRRLPAVRDRYVAGRTLAHCVGLLGWLVALAVVAVFPTWLFLHAEEAAGWSNAEVLPMAGGAAGALVLGFGAVLVGHMAQALFDQANAARDLLALERARQDTE